MTNDKTNDEGKKSLSLDRLDKVVGGTGGGGTNLDAIRAALDAVAAKTEDANGDRGTAPAPADEMQRLKDAVKAFQQEQTALRPERDQTNQQSSQVARSMAEMRTSYAQAISELNQAVASSSNSPADMLRIQQKLQQVTMQQDLMGKVVSKSEQNIDTLLKGQ